MDRNPKPLQTKEDKLPDLKGVKILVDTQDVDRLVKFYTSTFGLAVKVNSEHWGEIEFGTAAIGLHPGGDAAKEVWTPLSFTVGDIEKATKAVEKNGGTVVKPPYDPGEGPFLLATYKDPENNYFMASQDL